MNITGQQLIGLRDVDAAESSLHAVDPATGRALLANGYPTGVEVSDAMVHGGPWPR